MDLFPSPHPLTPPQSEEDALAWLRLLRSRRVGVATFFRLMREHGDAHAALAALPEVAAAAGVKGYRACPQSLAEAEMQAGRFAGARLVAFGGADYPAALADIPDPPPLLWALGDLALANRASVAMVGARNASSLGIRMARSLAGKLSEAGYAIASGLARGIDTAAHQAALDGGTIAVMAGGVDVIYPKENTVLAEEIARKGLRISEQPMGLSPQARHFPRRNRIISGLARGVVVVEAAAKSGSQITAREALDQGREVLAVPGHPFDARAAGCNMLIRDGATLVRGSGDVIEALGEAHAPQAADAPVAEVADLSATKAPVAVEAPEAVAAETPDPGSAKTPPRTRDVPPPTPERRTQEETRALHEQILSRLGPSPLAEDQLIRDLALPAGQVAPELVTLELEGHIARQPGGLLARTN